MKSFKQHLMETRSPEQAKKFYSKFQKQAPRKLFGGDQPVAGRRVGPFQAMKTRYKPVTTDMVTVVDIKDIHAGQPYLDRKTVHKYIDHYHENPDHVTDKRNKYRVPQVIVGDDGKMVATDGHHRLAAMASLGHRKIAVHVGQ